MITVELKYLTNDGDTVTDEEVSRIFVTSETEHAVILSVETKTKYPKPRLYSGCGVQFDTAAGNIADIKVRDIPFENVQVVAEAGRYNLHVILFHDVKEDARQVYDDGRYGNPIP